MLARHSRVPKPQVGRIARTVPAVGCRVPRAHTLLERINNSATLTRTLPPAPASLPGPHLSSSQRSMISTTWLVVITWLLASLM